MGLILVTEPGAEPVTTAEVKAAARVTNAAEDSIIASYAVAARAHVENFLGRSLITQTWRLTLDDFPRHQHRGLGAEFIFPRPGYQGRRAGRYNQEIMVRCPRSRLISVTSILYTDTASVQQTLDAATYWVDADHEPGLIAPAYGYFWPVTLGMPGNVRVTYTAGYGTAPANVPGPIKTAILQLATHWFEERQPVNVGNIVTPMPLHMRDALSSYVIHEQWA